MNTSYQSVIMANNPGQVKHMYNSLEDMLDDKPCSLHESHGCKTCCTCSDADSSPCLGVTGSPCNPYSIRRAKRFQDGSISEHSMNDTTQGSVIKFYQKFEPRTGISEQVMGFGMRTSSSVSQTPCEQFPGQ